MASDDVCGCGECEDCLRGIVRRLRSLSPVTPKEEP